MRSLILALGIAWIGSPAAWAKVVHYDLEATRGSVNLSGKRTVDFALQLNGSIPAPTLEFTEGDDAEIVVKNSIPGEEVSLHWHGILVPPEMDGVPYLTTPPIHSGESRTFRFPIRQHGTYWYHSHTNVQEQKGLFGAFVIRPRRPASPAIDVDRVVLLSDWSDEDGLDILNHLKKDGDYYQYKKGTVRSWFGALRSGGLLTYLFNEWSRMGGMDLSDVGYDAFLMNGKQDQQLTVLHPGQRLRLRLINASASSYFYVSLGQTPLQVIAADGIDITPVRAQELLMGMAETYDVLFSVPEHKNYELRATAQDGTGSASAWIGMGERVPALVRDSPGLYEPMDHSGHGSGGHSHAPSVTHEAASGQDAHAGHEGHAGHTSPAIDTPKGPVIPTLSVDHLRASADTAFPATAPLHEVELVLGGDMGRYVWHINGKAIHEERNIPVREGDVIRFTFVNETMMHHPMHLHGHFFRVLNDSGVRSPLKHTVDVPPHSRRVIEFRADEPGEWMLHCHNLYHLKSGMARVVQYLSFKPSPQIQHYQHQDPHHHDHGYLLTELEAATQHSQAHFRLSQTWNQIDLRGEARYAGALEFEGDLFYRRWFSNYFTAIAGASWFLQLPLAVAGIGYRLPLLIDVNALIDHRGRIRLDAAKHFQWTSWLLSEVDLTWRPGQASAGATDLEYEITLMVAPQWNWSAGLMWTEESLGAGVRVRF